MEKEIYMNIVYKMIKNFKELIMMLNNSKAKKVGKYYLKLEEFLDK
jgi:hypothetical protein